VVVVAATGYYTNVIGWVLYYALGFGLRPLGIELDSSAILPPPTGFSPRSFSLQLLCTAIVIWLAAFVLQRGLRRGIERASVLIMPALYLILIAVIVRAVTLPGARAGIDWYILKFSPGDVTASAAVAAMGQAIFSLSLGGTFMVAYGSYLAADTKLGGTAVLTALGDTLAGLLAGLAIFPAVFALGLEPGSGPSLLFSTLPETFARMPAGLVFGALFFIALFGAAYLSDVAALEVLIAGLTDTAKMNRRRAVWIAAGAVFVASIPPMINLEVFVPWDLTFGSGMQTLGALLAAVTLGWCLNRSRALAQFAPGSRLLYAWIRFVIPAAILSVAAWWLSTEVLK
jgi:NSS family neurotransmitter:Na+ symporter